MLVQGSGLGTGIPIPDGGPEAGLHAPQHRLHLRRVRDARPLRHVQGAEEKVMKSLEKD